MSCGTHGSRVRVLQRWEDQGVSSVAPRQKHYRSPTLGDAKAQSSRVLIQPLMCWRDTQFCFLTGGETPDGPEAGGRLSRLTSCSLFSGCWASSDAKCVKIHVLIQMYTDSMTDSEDINALNSIYKYTSGGTMAKILKKPKWIRTTETWMIYCFFFFFVLIN